MANQKQGACGRVDIGGQAVMEGVMMKAPDAIAISVRRPDGTIVTRRTPYEPLSKAPVDGLAGDSRHRQLRDHALHGHERIAAEHGHAGNSGRGAQQV